LLPPRRLIAVRLGFITTAQRDERVAYQTSSEGVLGELLAHSGYLTEARRDQIVRLKLV